MRGLFVTGTDTGVGKTLAAVALLRAGARRGLRVAGMKPVASGCVDTPAGLRNDDALALQAAATEMRGYGQVNPYAFAPAIAPHIAAARAGVEIDFGLIEQRLAELAQGCDLVVVEGVGGWRVPLNAEQDVAALAQRLGLPVILVVGLRLGCINHALLTVEALRRAGVPVPGWVASHVDPDMEAQAENLRALKQHLGMPLLGELPWDASGRPRFRDEDRLMEKLDEYLRHR